MNKKTLFKNKPTRIDDWVEAGGNHTCGKIQQNMQTNNQSKRLTIDVPVELHRRFKAHCASLGIVMADKIRDLLEKEFLVM